MPVSEVPPDLIGCSGLYNSPDPLLRRLRLETANGAPVMDIASAFDDIEVVVLYAGCLEGSADHATLQRDLTKTLKRDKKVAVIYVSTDTDAKSAAAGAAAQPWSRMIFHDDSDFASREPYSGQADVQEVARGEEFVQAGEIELGAVIVPYRGDEYIREYVRPLSRAAVAVTMRAYSTPSVAIYHVPTHQFIARNVGSAAFRPAAIGANLRKWRDGGVKIVRPSDLIYAAKMPLIFLLLALIYNGLLFFGGDKYNVLPRLVEHASTRIRSIVG